MKYPFSILFAFFILFISGGAIPDHSYFGKGYKSTYIKDLKKLCESSSELRTEIENSISEEEILKSFHDCKRAYKKIEFLADYLDHDFCNKGLNGAPLLKLEKNTPVPVALEPQGLQRMEELVYEQPIPRTELKELSKRFEKHCQKFYALQSNLAVSDRQAFDAMKFGLDRIFTMDLTGFDSPASDSALAYAKTSFGAIKTLFTVYLPRIRKKDPNLGQNMKDSFSKGKLAFETQTDFDEFDRLTFLREVINPLSEGLESSRIALGIESWSESYRIDRPTQEDHPLLFDPSHLDPYFYSKFPKEEDNETVRDLGKSLFFNKKLSVSGEKSCSSCHDPKRAFSDGKRKSLALGGKGTTPRNSPGLINAIYAERYFHDLRSNDLESQIENVLFNPKEFSHSWKELGKSLNENAEYLKKFQEAFPQFKEEPANKYSIASALTSYIISLQGWNSEFDLYARGETSEIDADIQIGFNLFMGKGGCGTCHFAPTFAGLVPPYFYENESEVLGIPEDANKDPLALDPDPGRAQGQVSERIYFFKHSFKTPSIRNIQHTGPYMHNGVYDSLDQVMDFYNVGGGQGLGLEVSYQTLPSDSLTLSNKEIDQIILFMESLEDLSSTKWVKDEEGY